MGERTAMFIDIQGFSALYEPNTDSDSLWGLSELMEGVFRLGRESTRLGISRVFVHHVGDGFVLVDDGGRENVNRLIGAAIALHQFTLFKSGHFCASAVCRGNLADITGCFPKIVTDARGPHGVIQLGEGLMTIMPVMGTAIINTYRMLKKAKGSVSLVLNEQADGLDSGIRSTKVDSLHYVDWLTSTSPTVTAARQVLGIDHVSPYDFKRLFDTAVTRNKSPTDWVEQTERFLKTE